MTQMCANIIFDYFSWKPFVNFFLTPTIPDDEKLNIFITSRQRQRLTYTYISTNRIHNIQIILQFRINLINLIYLSWKINLIELYIETV